MPGSVFCFIQAIILSACQFRMTLADDEVKHSDCFLPDVNKGSNPILNMGKVPLFTELDKQYNASHPSNTLMRPVERLFWIEGTKRAAKETACDGKPRNDPGCSAGNLAYQTAFQNDWNDELCKYGKAAYPEKCTTAQTAELKRTCEEVLEKQYGLEASTK